MHIEDAPTCVGELCPTNLINLIWYISYPSMTKKVAKVGSYVTKSPVMLTSCKLYILCLGPFLNSQKFERKPCKGGRYLDWL